MLFRSLDTVAVDCGTDCTDLLSVVSELGFGMFIEVSAEESEADATDMIEEDRSEL